MKMLPGNVWCFLLALLLSAASAGSQVINSFSPLFASPGEIVVFQGSGFTGVSTVQFSNGKSATFTVTADTQISATVPSGTVSGPIGVLKSGNLVFSVQSFTAIGPGPYVDSFTPETGNQGVQVTFTGVHFTGVTSVSFNGVAGTSVSVTADTQLRATVPAGATSGSITVTSPAGSWTTSTPFYLPPSISSFSPASGTPGTAVTINGANYLNASAVRFNGVSAAFTVNTASRITATVPAGATSGTISVTAPAGGGSSASSFTVLVPPTIGTQPASRTVAVGSSVTFSVTASGATGYQWRYNSANISGANSSSFTKSNLQLSDSGNYDVLVSNTAGSVTSSTASLTVAVPPAITSHPQSLTVNPGVSATFSASASGSALSYQWRRNVVDISGANGSSYTLASPQAADSGSTFSVVVNNAVGSATSSAATLTVNVPPSILSQPSGNTIFAGQNVTFSVSVTGSTPFTYQWQKNSANISGATASSYSINNAQTTHAGSYRVVVNNPFGSVTSDAATLTLNNPVGPSFTLHPQNQTVDIGQTATFSAAATGSPSPAYQWRKNGANISGATGSSYTVSNVQLTHAGTYDVVASNLGGSATSSGATLTVNGPPVITGQPASQTVVVGTTITLNVTASGASPLTYQWRREGTNLAGATSSSLVLNAAQPGDSGYYSVVITNPNGTTTSTTATINVLPVGASPNRVLTLDGNGDFVTIPSAADLQSQETFTLEGWFYPVANAANTHPLFINKGDGQDGGSSRSYEVQWQPDVGFAAVVFLGTSTYASLTTPAPLNQWTHIALTYDSKQKLICLYKNGLLTASSTNTDAGVPLTGQTVRQTTLPLVFGVIPGGPPTHATGSMDEVRIWSRVRSPEEIAGSMLCRLAGNEPGLAGYWTFDDGTASDLTGHGHHGVLSGDATTTLLLGAEPLHTTNQTPCITSQPQSLTVGIGQSASFAVTAVAGTNSGPFSYQWRKDGTNLTGATNSTLLLNAAQAESGGNFSVVVTNQFGAATSATGTVTVVNRVLALDGGGDFVTIPSAADLQSPDTFTLEAWIFPSAFGTNTSGQFLNKGDGQSVASVRSYELTWTPDRRIVLQVFLDTTTWAAVATPAEQDRWVHVAVTYDSGPGRLSLFTNGLLAASTTRDASGQVFLAGQRIRQTALPLVFGQLPGNGNSFANGQMDEVRIWSRVRSPEEIAGSMLCRLAGNEPGLAGYWTFDDGTARDITGHGHDGVFSGNASGTDLLGSDPLHSTNQTPCITSLPQSLTVGIGQSASFSVTAVAGTNTGPFSYQWRKDGTNLAGATGATLVLNSVGTNRAGSYTVVVSNSTGSVASVVRHKSCNI